MPSLKPENGMNPDTESCPKLPEEKLVDYLMHKLDPSEEWRVALHAARCTYCNDRLQEWAIVMQLPEMEALCKQESASGETMKQGRPDEYLTNPPIRLRQKLQWRFSLRSAGIRFTKKWRIVFPVSAAAVVMICLVAGLFTLRKTPYAESIDRDVSSKIAVMQAAGYEQYPITPLPPVHGSGGVWLNRDSGEFLIVVDGLNPPDQKDYQVWIQHEQQSVSSGMLLTQTRQGQGYYYGFGIIDPDQLVISLEPKGGSRVPTGPEALRISLNGNP